MCMWSGQHSASIIFCSFSLHSSLRVFLFQLSFLHKLPNFCAWCELQYDIYIPNSHAQTIYIKTPICLLVSWLTQRCIGDFYLKLKLADSSSYSFFIDLPKRDPADFAPERILSVTCTWMSYSVSNLTVHWY